MITEIDKSNMRMAIEMSTRSKAVRAKVGCLLVTPDNIMIGSYNGTPSGWDNTCEYTEYHIHTAIDTKPTMIPTGLVTKNEVIHSELNAILHAAKQGVSIKDSVLYVTLSPCTQCSAMIAQSGIRRVVYLNEYRDKKGVDNLVEHGIVFEKLEM